MCREDRGVKNSGLRKLGSTSSSSLALPSGVVEANYAREFVSSPGRDSSWATMVQIGRGERMVRMMFSRLWTVMTAN